MSVEEQFKAAKGTWRRPKHARSAHFFGIDQPHSVCGAWWYGAPYAVTLSSDRRCAICSRAVELSA